MLPADVNIKLDVERGSGLPCAGGGRETLFRGGC